MAQICHLYCAYPERPEYAFYKVPTSREIKCSINIVPGPKVSKFSVYMIPVQNGPKHAILMVAIPNRTQFTINVISTPKPKICHLNCAFPNREVEVIIRPKISYL